MEKNVKQTQRIEYIDAMRGFTMILVVLHHVSLMGFGVDSAIGRWLIEFRMPLFFFVSGFVLYKSTHKWDIHNALAFLKKKLSVQLLSPFIFFCIYVYIQKKDFVMSLADPSKAGYWFTFMLFTYFLIYIACQIFFDKLRFGHRLRDFTLISLGLFVFVSAYGVSYLFLEKNNLYAGFVGGANLKYFLFFALGTLVKKYFVKFENLLDSSLLVPISVTAYFLMNVFYNPINGGGAAFRFSFILLTAGTGIVCVFAFFRRYQNLFNYNQPAGKVLQTIGRRTLDIYLLHYFLIPQDLGKAFPVFSQYNLPLIEFFCSLILAFLIIAACLGISAVLRTSPLLAHFLFGAKKGK